MTMKMNRERTSGWLSTSGISALSFLQYFMTLGWVPASLKEICYISQRFSLPTCGGRKRERTGKTRGPFYKISYDKLRI